MFGVKFRCGWTKEIGLIRLGYLFPMYSFSTPWKHQKTDFFQRVEKGCIGNKSVKFISNYNVQDS